MYLSLLPVKVQKELIGNRIVFLLHLYAYLAHVTLSAVVQPAVEKNEVHVGHEALNTAILVLLQLLTYRRKVHRILDDLRVVGDFQLNIIDRILKDIGLLVPLERGQGALGGFLPLVVDGGAVGHLRHFELAGGPERAATVTVKGEIISELGVFDPENLKLGI